MKSNSNAEFREAMKKRTKQFALRIIRLVEALPDKKVCWDMGRQLLRSGTSVGANYRAACRARSQAEFRSKLGIVEEEADETLYWMELLLESGQIKAGRLDALMAEADELLRITVASIKNTDLKTATADPKRPRKKAAANAVQAATPDSGLRIPTSQF